MALSEQEEFELLSLERAKAQSAPRPQTKPAQSSEPSLRDYALKAASLILPGGAARASGVINDEIVKSAYDVGGTATDIATKAGASPQVAAGIGTVANTALQAIPMVMGAAVASTTAPAVEAGAKGLMQSALKPTIKDLRSGKAERAVTTLLDEGINVSKGGVEALRNRALDLNKAVESAIQSSGATVDKGAVASRVQDVLAKVEKDLPHMPDQRQAVQTVYDNFVSSQVIPRDIPVSRANEIKQGIYRFLKDEYGKVGNASVEGQKALARGLKEEINAAVPGVEAMNARASDLWNALNVTERRALMQANNNPGGLALLANNPTSFLAFMADKSATFKSIVARLLYSNKQSLPAGAGAIAGGAYNAVTQPNPDFPRQGLR